MGVGLRRGLCPLPRILKLKNIIISTIKHILTTAEHYELCRPTTFKHTCTSYYLRHYVNDYVITSLT